MMLLLAMPATGFARDVDDDTDTQIRLNPELGSSTITVTDGHKYPYIRYDLNRIDMNGDNWKELAEKLRQSRSISNFTVVHIGDSHIQADGNTGTTRKRFQSEYGDAGRGVIIPFRLAGTNEPLDYSITSSSPFVKSTLMRTPWATEMGFTGVALKPQNQNFSFNLSIKSECGYFTILCDGDLTVEAISSGGKNIEFDTERVDDGVYVSMFEDLTEFTIDLTADDVTIYGFDLRNDSPGVLYHAIGNNGAAYSSYNAIASFGESLSSLDPDLVIISLGTNEAFGKLDPETFTAQIAVMVRKIRKHSPDAKLLLVTPSECQRTVYAGRRRRKRARSKSYQVNTNVAKVRQLIIDYGKQHNIPVYDFYAVAGGEGASAKWLSDHLLSADRIHRTWDGYRLDGNLMYEALHDALTH